MINTVRQGATFAYEYQLSGDDTDAFTYTMDVMKYPDATPAISRSVTPSNGKIATTLTSTETAGLSVGRWWIHIHASDSDEDLREPVSIDVTKGWI